MVSGRAVSVVISGFISLCRCLPWWISPYWIAKGFIPREQLFHSDPHGGLRGFPVANPAENGVEGNEWHRFATRGPGLATIIFFAILLRNRVIGLPGRKG